MRADLVRLGSVGCGGVVLPRSFVNSTRYVTIRAEVGRAPKLGCDFEPFSESKSGILRAFRI